MSSTDSTPEWRPIPEWEGIYEVSSDGKVRRIGHYHGIPAGLRKLSRDRNGYRRVNLSFKTRRSDGLGVHRLVLLTFVGPCPNGWQARHLNGKPWDNRLENLSWASPKDNQSDRPVHGTDSRGERCVTAKLTTADVRDIRTLAKEHTRRAIAAQYKIVHSTVTSIVNRKTWKHVL